VHVASSITGNAQSFSFAVLHFGDQNITAAVKGYSGADASAFEAFSTNAAGQVQRADFPEVIRTLDRFYGHANYSLTSLFTDEQRRIVRLILNSTLSDIENSLTTIYQDHAACCIICRRQACPSRRRSLLLLASPSMPACGARSKWILSMWRSCALISRWPRPIWCRSRPPRSLTSPTCA